MFSQTCTFSGLGTVGIVVPLTAVYRIEGHISLPTLSAGSSPSSCLTLVKLNSTTKYTGTAGDQGFGASISATAGDTINVVLSSAATVDQPVNTIKTTVALWIPQ